MTPLNLLDALQKLIRQVTKDIMLQVRARDESGNHKERPAEVYKMRIPDKEGDTKLVPYILLQLLTGKDDKNGSEPDESICTVRIIVVTYSEDAQKGSIDTLNVITRLRTNLLKIISLDEKFILKKPLEYMIYTEDTAPYFIGEMMTIWRIPTINKEVEL